MKRLGIIAALAGTAALAIGTPGWGDDLGTLLERAGRNVVREAIERPQGPGAPGRPAAGPAAGASAADAQPFAIKTADGWTLVAHRYKPAGAPRAGAMPVILCHGLTYNAMFWDLDPSCSFARYLAALGYDVWAVDLRGCGASEKWVWRVDDAPAELIGGALRRMTHGKAGGASHATIDPKFANWNLDHHIAYDVPALVKLVRHHTGAAQVAWVGHSMGGIVALGHLARYPNPGIGRLATVGSQVTMPNGQLAQEFLRQMFSTRQRQLTGELTGQVLMDQTKTTVHDLFFNVQDVDPKVYEALGGWATDVPALGLMKQYSILSNTGELLDARKEFNYAKALGNITIPVFLSCGSVDQFAPPVVQQYLYAHVGSTDKTLVVFGRAQGLSVDCGHDDALVGLQSRAQVYPVIEKWLRGEK
jgi:pimeloyl-ACP methyl ester carboxylesterase